MHTFYTYQSHTCYLPEGVSQVAVDDPVEQMFLLIEKFTDLVAEARGDSVIQNDIEDHDM